MESSFPSFFHSSDLQYVMMKNVPYWVISLLLLQRCFHVFSVFVLTEAPEVWQCCLLLCWAEYASVGLACRECWVQGWHHTLHTLLWDLSAQGQMGWEAQLEQPNPGGVGGICMEAPIAHGAAKPLWQPCALLMGKPPGMVAWPCSSIKRCKFRALPQQAACGGWDPLLPLNHSSASSWQAGMSWLWRADGRKDRQPLE